MSSTVFETIIILFSSVLCLGLSAVVYKANPHRYSNRYFVGITFGLVAWFLSNYMSNQTWVGNATIWIKATFAGAVLALYFFTLFSLSYPGKKPNSFEKTVYLVATTIFLSIITFTPYVVAGYTRLENSSVPIRGPFTSLLSYFIITLALRSIIGLGHTYVSAKTRKDRRSMQILGLGMVGGILSAITTNLIAPVFLGIQGMDRYAYLSAVIMVVSISYGIINYNLFDVRLIISRTVIYTGLLTLILGTFALGTLGITRITTGVLTDAESRFASSLLAVVLLSFIYEPVRRLLAEKTDSWLFQKEYSQLELTHDLSKRLSDVIGLDEGLEAVLGTLSKALHLNHGAAYVFNASELSGSPVKRSVSFGYGELSDKRLQLTREDGLVSYVQSHPEIINVEELKQEIEDAEELFARKQFPSDKPVAVALREHAVRKQVLKKLIELEANIALPLVIGKARSGQPSLRRQS